MKQLNGELYAIVTELQYKLKHSKRENRHLLKKLAQAEQALSR